MNVSFIYFDNDLDIAPGPDEFFTYKPGDNFIMHWNDSLPTPEGYPYPNLLLRMYNVRYIREIDFAHHLPVLHPNTPINQDPIPVSQSAFNGDVVAYPAEPWSIADPDDNVLPDTEPDTTSFNPNPPLPKLNEICICEDTPDPTCPIHRNNQT